MESQNEFQNWFCWFQRCCGLNTEHHWLWCDCTVTATLTVMRSAATACHFLSVPEWGGLCCCWEVGL